jgi:hypothetical protein
MREKQMTMTRQWIAAVASAALGASLVSGALAASDAKKVEHAVSGAAHRVSEGFHKQVKEYHVRQARHQARKGNLHSAMRHAEKAGKHDVAEREQHHVARVKEKAVKND